MVPDAIGASKNIFFCAEMGTAEKGISLPAVRALRTDYHPQCRDQRGRFLPTCVFAAIANVPAGGPFFPASYHDLGPDDLLRWPSSAPTWPWPPSKTQKKKNHRRGPQKPWWPSWRAHGRKLATAAEPLKYQFTIKFGGIDFSLAPFPTESPVAGRGHGTPGCAQGGLARLADGRGHPDRVDRPGRFFHAPVSAVSWRPCWRMPSWPNAPPKAA